MTGDVAARPLPAGAPLSAARLIEAAIADDPDRHDPFEAFSVATGAAATDPHPYWRELQERAAILEGGNSPPGEFSMSDFMFGDRKRYSVLRFEEAAQVFRDDDVWSSAVLSETFGQVWGRTMIEMDEPEHGRYRRLISQAFTRREMDRWEHDIARPLLRRFLDALRPAGRADLVRELLLAFPATVMGTAIGLPDADLPRFLRQAVEMTNITFEPERALAASTRLAGYLRDRIDERRAHPGGEDLLSALVTATLAPEDAAHATVPANATDGAATGGAATGLTDEEIVSFVRLLLIAGAETTARSSATMLMLLLQHPEQLAAVRANRSLIPAAVEESLRLEPPLNMSTRVSTAPSVVGGLQLPADTAVQVVIGAVNRDPARWERPSEFDIHRERKGHLAFVAGAHVCLGMHLARMEMRLVLEEVLDRLPGLRLDPAAGPVAARGKELRSPPVLPVLFEAGAP